MAKRRHTQSALPLPPGPPSKGILGNVSDIPVDNAWTAYARMADKYGPIVHLRALNKHVVVLNTLEAMTELFERRGAIYSDRPRFRMLELMGWFWNIGLMPYGPKWREHRLVLHQFFNEHESKTYAEIVTHNNTKLLRSFLEAPNDFYRHVRHLAASNVLSISYGIDASPEDDPWVKIVSDGMESFGHAGTPGAYLIDWIPLLKYVPAWFPGAVFKRRAMEWRPLVDRMLDAPFDFVKSQLALGMSVPSSVASALIVHGLNGEPIDEGVARICAANAYAAGAETTGASLLFIVLAMVLFPEKQHAAQDELDRVVGLGRLPQLSDRDSLPYVEAFMLEAFRLYPVVPLSMPHRVTTEDEYQGSRIPEGATVLANVWQILRDPCHYPDPHSFTPERYLKDGQLDSTVSDPRVPIFGLGRRVCVGRPLADSTVWLFAATVLACFSIRKQKGRDRGENDFVPEFHSGLVFCPEPFPCDISPRSETAIRSILLASEHF